MISLQFQASRQQLADGYLFTEEIIIFRKISKWRLVMSQKNTQIVRNFIEEVFNRKHYDRAFDFCSQDCVIHSPPYVGLGLQLDSRSVERVIISDVAPNGPCSGKLFEKDEIIRAKDAENTWESYQDLKSGFWGLGVLDTSISVTVMRDGKLLEIPLTRGRVEVFDAKLSSQIEIWKDYIPKYWPDINSEIKMIIGEADLVAVYAINSGTSLEYHHSAVWDSCDFYRLRDGKIIEMWGVENSNSEFTQMGYQITPPVP